MADIDKTIKGLNALYDAMHKNQCYACSYEFVETANEFGTEILVDALTLLKEQEDKIRQLRLALQIMNGNGIKVDTEGR